jgi:hypothetical protein
MSVRLVRRIFVSKREEATEGWRKFHNEELHNFYSSPNMFRTIKSRKMRCAGHVTCMGKMKKCTRNIGWIT